jgi:type IV secretion system protein VirB6
MAATFNGTSQMFTYIDRVVTDFVAANLGAIISAITPVIALGLTISLTLEGLFLMARPGQEPLTSLVERFVKYALVISIASAGGWYQTSLANVAMRTPDEFASILIIDNSSGSNQQNQIASVIDQAVDNGLNVAKVAFTNANIYSGAGITSGLLGATTLFCTVLMCGMGAGLILMAKFLLGITVVFGPVFIFALLFRGTSGLFDRWLGTVINYGMVTVLVAAVFGLLMHFFSAAISAAAKPNSDSPILVAVVTCGLITVVAFFVMKEVPHMAHAMGHGVSADIFRHLRRSTQPPSQKPAEASSSGGTGNTGGSTSPPTSNAGSNSASSNSASTNSASTNSASSNSASSKSASGQTAASSSESADGSGMQGFAKGSRS